MMFLRTRLKVLIFAVFIAIFKPALLAGNETAPILLRLQNETTSAANIRRNVCKSNPATMQFLDSLSISCAGTSFIHDKGSIDSDTRNGNGFTSLELGARSYYRLSGTNAVWGKASYTNTLRHGIRECNIIDYPLLAPYTLGDSIGGNLRCQQYAIGGGWSHSYGKWSVGIGADYRAETANRSRDPRVNDIVSQLDLNAGVSRELGRNYILGIDGGFTTYSQTSDVKFMNPANSIMTQVYTGMGSVFRRFGSNIATASAYSLKRYSGGIQIFPKNRSGLFLNGEINHTRSTMYIRNLNNLPFANTSTLNGNVQLGWFHNFSHSFEITPYLQGYLMKRIGTENIFGSPVGSKYPVIGERENYKENISCAMLALPLTWRSLQNYLSVDLTPSTAIETDTRQLISPALKTDDMYIIPSVSASVRMVPAAKFAFSFEGGVSRRYKSEENLKIHSCAGISYAIGPTALHLQIQWIHGNIYHSDNYNFIGTSLSIIF